MLLFKQLHFLFGDPPESASVGEAVSFPRINPETLGKLTASPTDVPLRGRDAQLEKTARDLLHSAGATPLVPLVRVEWHERLRTAAGRADYNRKLISLNRRLREHDDAEIDRTLRHELAHLLAHFRAKRRRISPHGPEWRQACHDLGISDEQRCHTLPFPIHRRTRRLLYRCPSCAREFPRVRRIRRAVACLACCRAHNRGQFDKRFKLRLIAPLDQPR
jgi:predicted SprT family Zn-dependent metalloprotease